MIGTLEHIAIRVPAGAWDAAVADLATMLGHTAERPDTCCARFQLANMALLIEPGGEPGTTATGLSRLAFNCPDLARAERVLSRRAVAFERTRDGLAVSPASSHGVPVLIGARPAAAASAPADPAAVAGLDHVVIRTPNPERAVAFWAGRLGLDLRLDRSNADWGARLLFFVCGDLVVEIAHDLKQGVSDGPDTLWGLSWRAADIARLHARMAGAGVAVSELRKGRRPNTQVFTVKSHTGGVPTLVIGGDGLARRGGETA
ncbi:MAG: VOC family protein, partial [Hyphomicrobiaceae bacterium]|nr:VOC family protein [Hyphomicrobiaceae bacterium]